jgi:L-threonylcarbamoyladenylate synthase
MKPASAITIARAIKLLQHNNPVILPTETVYGIAANALNHQAVAKIYDYKNRPAHKPLIIHTHNLEQAYQMGHFSPQAKKLAKMLWPAPLTIIVKVNKAYGISANALAGQATVAIRIPHHDMMLEVLAGCGFPLAMPSANYYQQLSPTDHSHLKIRGVDFVKDNQPCVVGIESTIVDMTKQDSAIILRHGVITASDIATIITDVAVSEAGADDNVVITSGQDIRHYRPNKPLIICHDIRQDLPADYAIIGYGGQFMGVDHHITHDLSPNADIREACRNLYATLHTIDNIGKWRGSIIALCREDNDLAKAINDKIIKAVS